MNDSGFKRIHHAPRRAFRGADLRALTPQGRYLYDRSFERFKRRADAYLPAVWPPRGEIGRYESVRFITAERLTSE